MHQPPDPMSESSPPSGGVRAPPPGLTSVLTPMTFAASPAQVWDRLMYYEQIEARPPLHLRMLLPVPIRTIGRKTQVGDEAKCLYEGGHLIKRITQIDAGRCYAFEVIEQAMEVGGGMKLSGGVYQLREIPGGTEVTLSTRYRSPRRPRWLWKPIEAAVCHSFHRHILRAMRREAER
jgi:polyketide cyclase/dehydrase/lipid transport protein